MREKSEDVLSLWDYLFYSGISVGLFSFAGLMSGLTLGLLSLDPMNLKILSKTGTPSERKYASRIRLVLKNPHFLLATLLICNAFALEALPLFLDKMVSEALAIILSVSLILIFGEVIPQAVCSKWSLAIGGNVWWVVLLLMILVSPIAWPISILLDLILGSDHAEFFRRKQLTELVEIHGREKHAGQLSQDEVGVIKGALELQSKTVLSTMTPLNLVFQLNWNDKLDSETMKKMIKSGHSRVPVFKGEDRANIIGMLITKRLILLDPKEAVPVSSLANEIREIPSVKFDTPIWALMKAFSCGKSHMALVDDDKAQHLGIVTLEDIIEELIGKEIVDETDEFIDIQNQIRVAEGFKRSVSKAQTMDYMWKRTDNVHQKANLVVATENSEFGELQAGYQTIDSGEQLISMK